MSLKSKLKLAHTFNKNFSDTPEISILKKFDKTEFFCFVRLFIFMAIIPKIDWFKFFITAKFANFSIFRLLIYVVLFHLRILKNMPSVYQPGGFLYELVHNFKETLDKWFSFLDEEPEPDSFGQIPSHLCSEMKRMFLILF